MLTDGPPTRPTVVLSAELVEIVRLQNELVAGRLPPSAVADSVATLTRYLLAGSGTIVDLAAEGQLRCVAAAGIAAGLVDTLRERAGTLADRAIAQNRLLRCDDVAGDPLLDEEAHGRLGAVSVASAPLRRERRVIGALSVFSSRPEAFDTPAMTMLHLLADIISAHHGAHSAGEPDCHRSHEDPVTRLPNQEAFAISLAAELSRATRYEFELAVVLFELEQVDDDIAAAVAARLAELRDCDGRFHLTGRRFAMLLPHTDPAGAAIAVARLRERLPVPAVFGVVGRRGSGGNPRRLQTLAEQALLVAQRTAGA